MIKTIKVKCPNPKCKRGRIYEAVGFVGFDETCSTCGGRGWVYMEKQVPDVAVRHERHYYRH